MTMKQKEFNNLEFSERMNIKILQQFQYVFYDENKNDIILCGSPYSMLRGKTVWLDYLNGETPKGNHSHRVSRKKLLKNMTYIGKMHKRVFK